jgi:epoxyqueuosine reductase
VSSPPSVEELQRVGLDHGLAAVGFARAEVFESTRRDLHERKEAGLNATMQFTYRNPDRSTDPTRALPGARSIVVGAMGYLRDPPLERASDEPFASVARYVWDDFYGKLRLALDAVAGTLRSAGFQTRVLADDNALVDREAAHRAGIGWYGKNANILLPGKGSWFVLGSVLTDAELSPSEPVADGCGPCTRCLGACPTGAIVDAGVVDARRCLAWLVQAEGVFPRQYRIALGDRIYGCDDCQLVCPPNRAGARQARPLDPDARGANIEVRRILDSGDDELMSELGHWYIPRRDPRYLRRNALVVLGNTGSLDDDGSAALIDRWLDSDDELLRAHAVWAARRLGVPGIEDRLAEDTSALVREELDARVEPRS